MLPSRRTFTPLLASLVLAAIAACSAPGSAPSPAPSPEPEPVADAVTAVAQPLPPAPSPLTVSVQGSAMPATAAPEMYSRVANAKAMLLPAPGFAATANTEIYAHYDSQPLQRAAEQPVSTFSVDVDTGAYANVRRLLRAGQLPPADAVRVEELVNYFDYADTAPNGRDTPFAIHTELAPTPWNPKTLLLRIGIRGWEPANAALPPSNLVFLVDVSGSMNEPDKLPLVRASLKMLAHSLRAEDRIALVVYAGASGVVLPPTPGDEHAKIDAAIDSLEAGGSTNGASGIRLAYQLARQSLLKHGNNRVMLATDGDFNVGTTNLNQLLELIRHERADGIALTTLGVGSGNYNDQLMEQLADAGDGNYAYLDSLQEAQKVLVQQRKATLLTIARDVKLQLEFNPERVAEYRLIGYENRALKREDFANDAVDAGDIGAGHRVTALYEIALKGSGGERIAPLRYGKAGSSAAHGEELAELRLRWKRPDAGVNAASALITTPIHASQIENTAQSSDAFRLAAAVAAYGQRLRGSPYLGQFGYAEAAALAHSVRTPLSGVDEFTQLAGLAASLQITADSTTGADIGANIGVHRE